MLDSTGPIPSSVFQSFFQGGFECSTHRLRDGQRLDMVAATGHDRAFGQDYAKLRTHGLATVRDGVRWHLIEPSPGRFDWSSLTPALEAARRTGTQVIWDLLHYGVPDDIDILGPAFVNRFARFAREVALHVRGMTDSVPFWCPINEISFHAWGGGDVGYLNPFETGRGFELKVQLARAAIAAMSELRMVDPRARFVHCEPSIVIHPAVDGSRSLEAADLNEAQFQAFDLICGRLWPQLGGDASFLDIVGLNYYIQNQWHIDGLHLYPGDSGYVPFGTLLKQTHARYGRPVTIAETGIEGERRASWFTYIADEVLAARQQGVPVEGLCLYPVVNHVGWDDGRICPSGLLGHEPLLSGRTVHAPLADAIAAAQAKLAASERVPVARSPSSS
jgi:beta-glucosidase/6-phospho-beta-glucosidase/beta-galactosidase